MSQAEIIFAEAAVDVTVDLNPPPTLLQLDPGEAPKKLVPTANMTLERGVYGVHSAGTTSPLRAVPGAQGVTIASLAAVENPWPPPLINKLGISESDFKAFYVHVRSL